MNSKIDSGFFPQMLLANLECNFVRIGQNLLIEVPVNRSIFADFVVGHLKILNRNLNESMKKNAHG